MKHLFVTLTFALAVCACGGASQASSSSTPPTSEVPAATNIPLKNASFAGNPNGGLTDWVEHEHNVGQSYAFTSDSVDAYSAPSSAKIHRFGDELYGRLDQKMRIDPSWVNKTLRLSGMLKSANADGYGGGLVIQATSGGGDILTWDHMDKQRLTGTQAWKSHTVTLKVPQGAYFLIVGFMLEGGGTLWADDLKLELLD